MLLIPQVLLLSFVMLMMTEMVVRLVLVTVRAILMVTVFTSNLLDHHNALSWTWLGLPSLFLGLQVASAIDTASHFAVATAQL